MFHPKTTLNCKGRLLDLQQPVIMGILNVTPDSFYDGGQYDNIDNCLRQVEKMLSDGAKIIDIGGMSSRPGAAVISTTEELRRVIPVITAIAEKYPEALLSIDTVHAVVAQAAVEAGAHLVNDISAGQFDENLYATVAELGVPYVLMHMQGTPKTMQQQPDYKNVLQEVLDFFIQEVGKLRALGIKDIILDPGFGFGKSLAHNYHLLANLHVFKALDLPILAGISRKSMIYKALETTPDQALNGTTALHMIALQQGVQILRVHDARSAYEVTQLFKKVEDNKYLK